MTRTPLALPVAATCLVAIVLAAPSAGGIDVPQTREEFVRAVSAGARGVRMESFAVERPFEDVYRSLEANAIECLDVVVRRTAYVGYVENSSSDYNPTLRRIGPDRAEFTLQVVHHPRGVGHTPPEGGLYVMAADVTRAGAARTEVVLYRPTMGFNDVTRGFLQWVEGRGTDCPKLK